MNLVTFRHWEQDILVFWWKWENTERALELKSFSASICAQIEQTGLSFLHLFWFCERLKPSDLCQEVSVSPEPSEETSVLPPLSGIYLYCFKSEPHKSAGGDLSQDAVNQERRLDWQRLAGALTGEVRDQPTTFVNRGSRPSLHVGKIFRSLL